jgi:uncharacterized membrane protein YdbT with pleckstrin-like domain
LVRTTEQLARTTEQLSSHQVAGGEQIPVVSWYADCDPEGSLQLETPMSSFSTYLIGFIVLIIGLAIAAILVGVSQTWVIVGAIILIGIAIITATTRTKTKDPPAPPA